MKRATQLKFNQLFVIIILWTTIGLLISLHDHFLLHTQNSLGVSPDYSFFQSALRNMTAGFIGAILGGSLLVFYINVKYQDKPYGYTIVTVSISFIIIIAIISVILGVIFVPIRTGKPLSDPVSQVAFAKFLRDPLHVKAAIAWSFVVAVTQLMLQVNSKFGQGVFWNIMRGRYNTPKEEKRIFMFLDINSSTTIAEQLGDEQYHALLKDFFADITNPIVENKGTIYQYVGDEVVVAWNYDDGIQNQHCIRCFFDMKLFIQQNKTKYMDRYGLVPSFKAGIHCGRVIAGEVGIIKRDITYSGDVLNTTSRILGKCSELNAEMIASSDLLSEISLSRNYITTPLGAIKLKGKEKEISLSALTPV